jgi:transposase
MPWEILELGKERLTAIISKISRKRLGKSRAEALYTAAQTTVGITEGLLAFREAMIMLKQGLNMFEDQLKRVEEHIRQLVEEMPAHRILTSMKGIGLISSATIIAEVVDFNFYHSASELLKLAGLDLYEISSGKHRGRLRISKRGRSLLRKVLYFASLNMVKKGGIFHEIYQKYRSKGKPGPKSLIAISRKLLRTIFSMVKNNVVYNSDFMKLQMAA